VGIAHKVSVPTFRLKLSANSMGVGLHPHADVPSVETHAHLRLSWPGLRVL
jgi:hypothetical protein